MTDRGRPRKNKKLAKAIGEAFTKALGKFTNLGRGEAAALLGITRDGLQRILRGESVPKPEILSRASALFGVIVEYEEHRFGAASFQPPNSPHDSSRHEKNTQFQLKFDRPVEFWTGNLRVSLVQKKNNLLQVLIKSR